MDWYDHGHGMSAWGWVGTTASILLVLALLVLGGLLLVRSMRRPPAGPPPRSPEQVLAERFARGEIGEEEYRSRLAALTGRNAAPR